MSTTTITLDEQLEFDFGSYNTMLTSGSITDTLTLGANTLGNISTGIYTTVTNGTGATNMPWITANVGNTIWDHATPKTLHVRGNAEFEGDITIKGVSLSERLDKIEERLNILRVNEDLESKWEKLRTLGRMYRELEAEIIDKQKLWDTLKA